MAEYFTVTLLHSKHHYLLLIFSFQNSKTEMQWFAIYCFRIYMTVCNSTYLENENYAKSWIEIKFFRHMVT